MTGIVSSFYRAATSCWNLPDVNDKAELDTAAPDRPHADGPLTNIIVDGKWCDSGAKVEAADFREKVDAGATDEGSATDGCRYKSLEEFVQPRTVRAAHSSVPPVDAAVQTVTILTSPVEPVETVIQRVAHHREKILAALKDAYIFGRNHQDESKDFLKTEMFKKALAIATLLPHAETQRLNQEALLDDNFKNLHLIFSYHDRQVEQYEMNASLAYWKKVLGAHVHAYWEVLQLCCETKAEKDRKDEFQLFLDTARLAGVPTLTLLHWKNHWMAFIADMRGAKPVFYIFDTNASVYESGRRHAFEEYLGYLSKLSKNEISPANTVYCGCAMQRHTPNACGVLACWILEQVALKMASHPEIPIAALFDACVKDWQPTGAKEAFQKRFVLHWRAELLARLHA